MARPLPSGKQSVSLATSGPRVSRIRRDPPPPEPEIVRRTQRARRADGGDRVITFALALVVIGLALMGCSAGPRGATSRISRRGQKLQP